MYIRHYRAFDFPDDDQAFEEGAAELMPEGEYGREWLEGLLSDLADDGLVAVVENDDEGDGDGENDEKGETVARLRR